MCRISAVVPWKHMKLVASCVPWGELNSFAEKYFNQQCNGALSPAVQPQGCRFGESFLLAGEAAQCPRCRLETLRGGIIRISAVEIWPKVGFEEHGVIQAGETMGHSAVSPLAFLALILSSVWNRVVRPPTRMGLVPPGLAPCYFLLT